MFEFVWSTSVRNLTFEVFSGVVAPDDVKIISSATRDMDARAEA